MTRRIAAADAVAPDGRQLTGWMVLGICVAFFGTVSAVNGVMIYDALSTFRGEAEKSPYEHGLAYERDIAAARAQDARHWQVEVEVQQASRDMPRRVEVMMRDAAGRALEGLTLSASLEFATDKRFDWRGVLPEVAPGIYRGDARIGAGQWDLVMEASRGGAPVFRSRNRLTLQ